MIRITVTDEEGVVLETFTVKLPAKHHNIQPALRIATEMREIGMTTWEEWEESE